MPITKALRRAGLYVHHRPGLYVHHRLGLYVHHRLGPKYFIQLSLLHPWLLHCGQCTATAELGVLLNRVWAPIFRGLLCCHIDSVAMPRRGPVSMRLFRRDAASRSRSRSRPRSGGSGPVISSRSRIGALENRIAELESRLSEYRIVELENRIVDLEYRNRDLSRQVDVLERLVQVLQAFSLSYGHRLAELERAAGLPTPPAGPPPATPAPAPA